jgi:hypothetical protein
MPAERKLLPSVIAIVLAPLLIASLFWASYRDHVSSADPANS